MFFKILFYHLIGYLHIRVEGAFVERFINICKAKKIVLWNIKVKQEFFLDANIGIGNFRRIRVIARKTNTKVKIQKKCGFPFLLNKYRKRKILGFILCLILFSIIVLSNFIWNISIIGNENISDDEIIQSLKEEGLKIGASKNKIDLKNIINNIRLKRSDIAWIGISIKGTNAIVKIKETIKPPDIIDEYDYCNIISDKEGVIIKISVQNGMANVKEGDIIKPGTVLVKGYLEGKYTGIRYVHANADIKAKVWHSKKEKVFLNQEIITDTGNSETKYSIKINDFKINFYKTLSKFKNYDTIVTSKKIKLFSDFYLPIEIIKTRNYEHKKIDVTYTEEELTAITISRLEEELKEEIQNTDNIVNTQINTYANEGYIEIEVIYEVIETIGIEDKIVF